MQKREGFTLLELLLVVTILSLALTSLSFFIHSSLQEQKFDNGVKKIVEKMRLAKELAIQMDSPVQLSIRQLDGSLRWELKADKPWSALQRSAIRGEAEVKGIAAFSYKGEVLQEFHLLFSRFGTGLPIGELTLHAQLVSKRGHKAKEAKISWQCLPKVLCRSNSSDGEEIEKESNCYPEEMQEEQKTGALYST